MVATQRVNKVKRIRNLFRVRFFCVLRHCGDMSVKGGRKWGGGGIGSLEHTAP